MTRDFLRLALILVFATACLPAQGETKAQEKPQLGPRSFFPREYTREFFLDVDALMDTTLWDALERMVFSGTMRMQFRREFGFRLDDIKSVRTTGRYIAEKENSEAGARDVSVTVIQGKTVRLPPVRKPEEFAYLILKKEKYRGYDIVREAPTETSHGWEEGRLYVVPKPGCLVIGSEEMIKSVIAGKRRGGVISSRLMALTAMRKPLGYVAIGFPPPDDPRYLTEMAVDPNWLVESDPLEHLIARLSYDEKTEHISFKATLRFKTGKEGPKMLEESVKATIEGMKGMKGPNMYMLVKSYFDKVEWKRDGVDLHVSVVIKPNDMTGLFGGSGLVAYFMMLAPMRVMRGPVLAAPARAAPVLVEVKDVKKVDAKKKKPAKKSGTEKKAKAEKKEKRI